ncbi:MAG TPA: GNAT family N-acetyltransferase [Dokdonella sp.]|uniref:GNAT family N-acetyltransferase n=1 Tax=Dokdonella sp. TaxID=2291710 RepID=UPI0025C175B5|nr:GNAT family N-acetyltransferase [Dokdonella sp.]MBX3691898.1 GNAT family N-acetyltransferase [Dokdonella sp.]MCW5568863.1 GNAT family N-acetyltransferase [Dokdonella sp.]HNR90862.1 GNAT family N-acetyltransferase [Dokdonella sp.]
MDTEADLHIRLADVDDDAFILGLVPRFVDGFELPKWRRRGEYLEGIRRDIVRHLSEQPAGTHVFVAENDDGERVGFLHLHTNIDFFSGAPNCHISDLAVADGHDGKGVGRALLAYAERWAREHRCKYLGLAAFPGNTRAIALYEEFGFGVEAVRMVKPLR